MCISGVYSYVCVFTIYMYARLYPHVYIYIHMCNVYIYIYVMYFRYVCSYTYICTYIYICVCIYMVIDLRKLPGGFLEDMSGVNIWSNDLVPDILLTSVVGAVISILATFIPRIFFCMRPLANRVWASQNSLACAEHIGSVWKESIERRP